MLPSSTATCNPSWTQTGLNTFFQPYGFQEVLYNAISVPAGSPGLFLIASSVTLKYRSSSTPSNVASPFDLIPLLRNTWLRMRQKYPGLAAENRPEGKLYASPSTTAELKSWLDSTFIVTPGKTSAEHWKTMVKTRQMTLNFFPEEGQLFLQGEHHILDGRGLMNFWDRFFKTLVAPDKGDGMLVDGSEVARLPPRSDDLLDVTEKRSGRGEQRAQEILAPLSDLDKPILVPVKQPLPQCALRNAVFESKSSVRTTSAIVEACKSQKLSTTASWHAAVILATQAFQERRSAQMGTPKKGTEFATFGNFDLRRYFPDPESTSAASSVPDAYAVGNHHCVLPCVTEPDGKTFQQLSREIGSFYQQDILKEDPEVWSAMRPMVQSIVPDFMQPQLQESTPALSSFGVVDNFISPSYSDQDGKGIWLIEDVWFGDTITGPWLECFLWTWRGRLSLNTCYNPAYYTYTEVDEFNQLVEEKLLTGLGIKSLALSMKL